jgi:hypothetical protein
VESVSKSPVFPEIAIVLIELAMILSSAKIVSVPFASVKITPPRTPDNVTSITFDPEIVWIRPVEGNVSIIVDVVPEVRTRVDRSRFGDPP